MAAGGFTSLAPDGPAAPGRLGRTPPVRRDMKYIIHFRLKPDRKNQLLETFEARGPNRNAGVTFRSAWIGRNADVVFVLAEGETEAALAQAAKTWEEFGTFEITPVIDVDQL